MKRFLTSVAALALVSGAAYAADLPTMEPAPMMSPVSAYNWSGFYIGPQVGWGWADLDVDDNTTGLDETINMDGFFAGGVAGAQWQWNWAVLGVEGELNWSDIDGDEDGIGGVDGNDLDGDMNWFGSISGKLGIAFDRFMIYGTGGVAFADAETGQSFLGADADDSQSFTGWTAGAGLDVAVTDSIIVGLQYRHYDFGSEDFELDNGFTDREGDLDLDTVSAHVTWKFGGIM